MILPPLPRPNRPASTWANKLGLAALWAVLLAALVQFYMQGGSTTRCSRLLANGSWDSSTPKPFQKWDAPDCALHAYAADNLTTCFAHRRLVFVGDSTVRQLYWAATTQLNQQQEELALLDFHVTEDKQRNLAMEVAGVRIEYIYDPWMNSSALSSLVAQSTAAKTAPLMPALIVLGTPAMWAARHAGDDYFTVFSRGIDTILPLLQMPLTETIVTSSSPSAASSQSTVLLIPPALPYIPLLTPKRAKFMSEWKFTDMHKYLRNLPFIARSHVVWAVPEMLARGGKMAYSHDGLHASRAVRDATLSLLLNVRCNAGLSWDARVDTSPSCCVAYPTPSPIRAIFLSLAFAALLSIGLLKRQGGGYEERPRTRLVTAAVPMLAACAYAYITDRTHVFIKLAMSGAQTTPLLVTGLVLCVLAVKRVPRESVSEKGHDEPVFLSRTQTDEWKGFLLVAILVCSFGDTSTVLLYKLGSMASSLFVLLSAFGHTRYFLRTGDLSLRRVGVVLARVNLLNVLLSLAVDATAETYPLEISFWFLCTWLIMRTKATMNANIFAFMFKLCFAFCIVQLIFVWYVFVPINTYLFNILLRTSLDVPRIYAALDANKTIIFPGMSFAVLTHRLSLLRSRTAQPNTGAAAASADDLDDVLVDLVIRPAYSDSRMSLAPVLMTWSAVTASLTAYTMVSTDYTPTHEEYDFWHPYIAMLLLTGIVYLRNCTASIKAVSFAVPSALGKYALEVSLLKSHVLFAGNGNAVLSLVGINTFKWVMVPQAIAFSAVMLYLARSCRDAVRQMF